MKIDWTKISENYFCTDVSDLGKENDTDCPNCGASVSSLDAKPVTNSEGEIESFNLTCRCGVKLVFFND